MAVHVCTLQAHACVLAQVPMCSAQALLGNLDRDGLVCFEMSGVGLGADLVREPPCRSSTTARPLQRKAWPW
jgi:hypothetical protein